MRDGVKSAERPFAHGFGQSAPGLGHELLGSRQGIVPELELERSGDGAFDGEPHRGAAPICFQRSAWSRPPGPQPNSLL